MLMLGDAGRVEEVTLGPDLLAAHWTFCTDPDIELLAGHGWPTHVRPSALRERVAQLRGLRRAAQAQDKGFDARENALVLATSFSGALEMRGR